MPLMPRMNIKIKLFNRPLAPRDLWKMRGLLFAALKRIFTPPVFLNLCACGYSILSRRSKVLHKPYYVILETSSRCNMSCTMCRRAMCSFGREEKDMPFDKFAKIIDELSGSLIFVVMWNYGEPLLNEALARMTAYCSGKGIITVLSTNGILLDREKINGLIAAGLKYLIISVDAASSDVYRIYRRGGDFDRLENNIKELSRAKKKLKTGFPIIDMQFVVMRQNEHQVGRFFEMAGSWGADRASLKRFSMLAAFGKPDDFLPENGDFILESLKKRSFTRRGMCKTPWRSMVINSDGSVVPCCSDYFSMQKMGNAYEEDVKDVWNNQKYVDFRAKVARAIHTTDICRQCFNTSGQEGSFIETRSLT